MANKKRLIPASKLEIVLAKKFRNGMIHYDDLMATIADISTVDAVEVVRCKGCRWAKPYKRNDGETGFYCNFCGHAVKYGPNWERLYTPVKEADDFCSYGERREGE